MNVVKSMKSVLNFSKILKPQMRHVSSIPESKNLRRLEKFYVDISPGSRKVLHKSKIVLPTKLRGELNSRILPMLQGAAAAGYNVLQLVKGVAYDINGLHMLAVGGVNWCTASMKPLTGFGRAVQAPPCFHNLEANMKGYSKGQSSLKKLCRMKRGIVCLDEIVLDAPEKVGYGFRELVLAPENNLARAWKFIQPDNGNISVAYVPEDYLFLGEVWALHMLLPEDKRPVKFKDFSKD